VKVGGLSPASTHLAEQLARQHEVHFFTRGTGGGADINGVHYHYCEPEGATIVEYCTTMCRTLLEVFRELDHPPFDIIHFHDWHFIDALDRLQNRNTVLSFHSTEYGRNGSNFGDWPEFREISGKEWYGGYIARKILTVSKNTKTEIMWLYNVPERKITVIPNGIFPEQYQLAVDAAAVKMKHGIHPLAPLVLFVGRLAYQKGPDLLLRAIPRVLAKRWDVQFIIAGDGAMRSQLEAASMGLPVQFLGYIDDRTHLELLNACDVVVIPSRNEPFGLVLTEAWSAARCVVATDVGGLGENIENFVDGIKVPPREESIAWGINYVIDDPALMQRLGRAGRMKVLTEFDWDLIVGETLDVYQSVLNRADDTAASGGESG